MDERPNMLYTEIITVKEFHKPSKYVHFLDDDSHFNRTDLTRDFYSFTTFDDIRHF